MNRSGRRSPRSAAKLRVAPGRLQKPAKNLAAVAAATATATGATSTSTSTSISSTTTTTTTTTRQVPLAGPTRTACAASPEHVQVVKGLQGYGIRRCGRAAPESHVTIWCSNLGTEMRFRRLELQFCGLPQTAFFHFETSQWQRPSPTICQKSC